MKPSIIPATTTKSDGILIPSVDLEANSVFSRFFDASGLSDYMTGDSVLNFLSTLWSYYALFAYLLCIVMLMLYVYAATRKKQIDDMRLEVLTEKVRIYDEKYRTGPKNNRMDDVLTHIDSDKPNDWKLAIIEADIILDQALKEAGYAGISLGERLKSIAPSQMHSLDDAWQAHKVRNMVAHGRADFVLTKRLADDTIKQYRRVFAELGVM